MYKQQFLTELEKKLGGLPQEDIHERLNFYDEIISDRMEEGLTEEEAVAAIGNADAIAAQIIAETPFTKIAKVRLKNKRPMSAGVIVLLILGSPVWLPILIAVLATIFSVYMCLWAGIVALWSGFAAIAGSALGCIIGGGVMAVTVNGLMGLAVMAAGAVCAGIGILAFLGCSAVTKGMAYLTKMMGAGIKRCLMGKGEKA